MSPWEVEQQRQVRVALSMLRPSMGECEWTGKHDNSGLGLVYLREELPDDEGDFDYYGWWYE